MIRKKKLESPPDGNMILASGVYLPTDKGRSILVFGGTGSGKYYYYIEPNLMQCNTSFVVSDPGGDLYRRYGKFLEKKGYKVKSLNLNLPRMDKGNHYNPFRYIHCDEDIECFVETLLSNTSPPEDFADKPGGREAEASLLKAVVAYLHNNTSQPEQNFTNIMKLLRACQPIEDTGNENAPLAMKLLRAYWGNVEPPEKKTAFDYIFDEVRSYAPDSYSIKQYDNFCAKAGNLRKKIVISCLTRLQVFDLWDVAELTKTDDIDFEAMGDEKTALFIITPTRERTFHFLAAVIYTQLFDVIAKHRQKDKASICTYLFLDASEMELLPNLENRIDKAKECGATITLFVHVPEIMEKYYQNDWRHISETYDVALLFSPRESSTRDWFQKHAEFALQKEAGAEKKRLFNLFNRKENSTDACLEDIRSLPEDECLVAIKGIPVKKVPKYAAKNHPSWFMVRNGR